MEEYLEKDEDQKKLFSQQLLYEIKTKLISCNDVVDKFLNANTTSDDDKKALSETKVVDAKMKRLIKILTHSYHRGNLEPLKIFIGVLEETKNIKIAKHLSVICDERENAIGILNRLAKEKNKVASLQREISRLQQILGEREYTLTKLRQEKRVLEDQLGQAENDKNELLIKITQKEKYICTLEKELDELATRKHQLETEVKSKSFVIDKREKEMEEKEKELQNAIRESNELRSELEKSSQDFAQAMGKEKEQLSKKIEVLESDILEKENEILDLRRNQTLKRGDLEEELKKITTKQENKIVGLTNKIDDLANKMNKLLEVLENKNT